MYKIANPLQFRENIRQKFNQQIETFDYCINMEKSIFNYTIKECNSKKIIKKWENPLFVNLYIDKLRSVFMNLTPEIKSQIETGEITPQEIAFLTHQELNPGRWKELIERKMKRDESKFNTNIQASTDMFTCKKCKSKKCTYYELQTRSADEPATIFITCLDCGKHWKI
jgi:DNA-directed RNA polymerase subunit M/transcription elongation factor TFIIS